MSKGDQPTPPDWNPEGDIAPSKPWGRASTLDRTDVVAAVAAASGQSQAVVAGVVDAFFVVVSRSIASGTKVSIPGWIAFEPTSREARRGRNPATGETIQIAASKGVKVSAGSKLKAAAKG